MKTADITVELIDHCGSDLSVVNAARVSFDKQSDWVGVPHGPMQLSERDSKLISYLARHKHTSPFNHCFASFRVKAPIFVARQLVKHKFLPWNEVSRRYVDSEPEFFIPPFLRERSEDKKQGSLDTPIDENDGVNWTIRDASAQAIALYNYLLDCRVAPEQARMVLPQNAMTEWIWSGTLGAWADMCRLRLDDHAQEETMTVALRISLVLCQLFPVSMKALLDQDET